MGKEQDLIEFEASLLLDEMTRLREESLLSQKQVATIMGLASHSSINAIEKKKVMPRLDTALKLLSVYGYELKIVPKARDDE